MSEYGRKNLIRPSGPFSPGGQPVPGMDNGAAGTLAEAVPAKKMTLARIKEAQRTLEKYKAGKAQLERRLKTDEDWWRGQSWAHMEEQGNPNQPKWPTKWLVNVILGKHADMVDAYPEPVILPREEGDEQEAQKLTSILPVILEQNFFDETFSEQAWEKNKHGTAAYAVYWDAAKLNGLGDVNICGIDLLNLFWEPGVDDIQQSENVFLVSAVNKRILVQQYPQLAEADLSSSFALSRYDTEDRGDKEEKALVVDWYYHTYEGGVKTLHYCKYCAEQILFASEDMPEMTAGWYEDGNYPFVLDTLFPQKESPCGWGYIDLGLNAQKAIDFLDYCVQLNAKAGAIPRYFRKRDSAINLEQFLDFTQPVVEVEGGLGEADMVPIQHKPLDGAYVNYLDGKIEELKQTCGNQDVTNGITSGVTAASGIAAQMEAAGRTSRDSNKGTYRAYSRILEMVIERIRQFYDVPRTFRILGQTAQYEYVQMDNSGLAMQPNPELEGMPMGWRKPVFDIQVAAQKQNAYTKLAQNELALQLLGAGVFNSQQAEQSLMLLDMMDFNGKDKLVRKLQESFDMHRMLAQWQQIALELAGQVDPALQEQMANQIMAEAQGMGGAPVQAPGAAGMVMQGQPQETKAMQRSREMANNVSQPG